MIILLIVYVPILALYGIEGKMFTDGDRGHLALLAALMLLSVTFIPATVALLLSRASFVEREDAILRQARRGYAADLDRALRSRIPARPRMLLYVARWRSASTWAAKLSPESRRGRRLALRVACCARPRKQARRSGERNAAAALSRVR